MPRFRFPELDIVHTWVCSTGQQRYRTWPAVPFFVLLYQVAPFALVVNAQERQFKLGGTAIAHDATTPAQQPFARTMWRGTCDSGQLTPGGLRDSRLRPPLIRAL